MSTPFKSFELISGSGNNTFQDITGRGAMTTEFIGYPDTEATDLATDDLLSQNRLLPPKATLSGAGFGANRLSIGNETAISGGYWGQTSSGVDRETFLCLIESDIAITTTSADIWPIVERVTITLPGGDNVLSARTGVFTYSLVSGKYYNVALQSSDNNVFLGQDTTGNGGLGTTLRDLATIDPPTTYTPEASVNKNYILWVEISIDAGAPTLIGSIPQSMIGSMIGSIVN